MEHLSKQIITTIWKIKIFADNWQNLPTIIGSNVRATWGFYLHSYIFIIIWKIIEIPINKSIIKHIEEMAAHDKVILLKFNNRTWVIYDNDWIAGVEYEDKNENCSDEDQEEEDYIESENNENKD